MKMKRRILSLLLTACLIVGLLPSAAYATETACTCAAACTAESINTDCPVCGVEGADLALCTLHDPASPAAETAPVEKPSVETTVPTEPTVPETTEDTEPEETTEETTEPTVPETTEATEPQVDEAVSAVQAMIDALPGVEDVTMEHYDEVAAAYEAFALLDETQMALVGEERIAKLSALTDKLTDLAVPLDNTIDTSWYDNDPTKTSYTITTAAELAGLAQLVNNYTTTFSGKTITLAADIDLSQYTWIPIADGNSKGYGSSKKAAYFEGTFDGNGKKITNLSITNQSDISGLFGVCKNGTIKNLTVYGTVSETGRGQLNKTAGIVGWAMGADSLISGCTNHVAVTGDANYIGGVCAYTVGKVENCKNYGTITSTSTLAESGWRGIAGGVVGYANAASINDCVNYGAVTSKIVGSGVCGERAMYSSITNCFNSANVTSEKYAGGICGYLLGKVQKCANTGNVSVTDAANERMHGAGGIAGIGLSSRSGPSEIINCYNTGTITSNLTVGGIIAIQYTTTHLRNCHSYGSVSGSGLYVGAIKGYWVNNLCKVENCFYLTGTDNTGTKGTQKTSDEFANGTVYKLLQGEQSEQVWGQTIDKDKYPVFFNGSNTPVIKENVTITVTGEPSYIYDGTAKSGYTGQVTATGDYDVSKLEYVYTKQGSTDALSGAPKDAGSYTLTIKVPSSDETYRGSATVNFTIESKEIGIQWSNTSLTYTGQEQIPTATATGLVDGDTCTITVTGGQTNAGDSYTATAQSVDNANYKLPDNKTTTFSIAKAQITDVALSPASAVYNAQNQTPQITAVKAGDLVLTASDYTVSYQDSKGNPVTEVKSAGTYKVMVTAVESSNFSGSKEVEWEIQKVTITVDVTPKGTYPYTGKAQQIELDKEYHQCPSEPTALNVTWYYCDSEDGEYTTTVPSFTTAGDHTIYYKLSGQNYNEVTGSCTVKINPAPLTISGATVSNKPYDGDTTATVTGVDFTGLVNNETLTIGKDYTVTGNFANADAGENKNVDITVTLTNSNYTLETKTYTACATITKATQNAPTGVTAVNETISGANDGKITGVDSTMEYSSDNGTSYAAITGTEVTGLAAGTYLVRYKADNNHDPSAAASVTVGVGRMLKINLPSPQTGYTLTSSVQEVAYNGSVTLTFTLAEGYTQESSFKITASNGTLTDNGNGTYTLSGVTEDTTLSVIGIADKTAPTAQITVKDNLWKEFLNTITFDHFFKETQTVTITAEDKGSGVNDDGISYYLSETALTLEQVKALAGTNWTKYADKFSISNERQYIIYAKVTDKAGNTTYISSDGLILDMTAPVISGVENGKTYYTTQKVTANDTYLESLAGVEKDSMIPGDVDKTYTIEATDKAGNSTTFTITMKPISSIRKGLPTMDTVKIADKAAIEAVKATATDVLTNQCANATDAEKAKLEQIIKDCEALLAAIRNAEDAIELIDTMPDASKTQPDDKTAIDAYEAAKAAYDKLTDTEKRMVGEENKAKLDAMFKALTAYDIIKGDGSTWTKGSSSGLSFTANGYYGKFTGIKVDGEPVDAKNYEAQSGSTVITLKASYLQTLKTSKHTIQVLYTDGATDGADTFTIKAASTPGNNSTTNGVNSPGTGDHSNMVLWISLLCVSAAGMVALLWVNKKRRSTK